PAKDPGAAPAAPKAPGRLAVLAARPTAALLLLAAVVAVVGALVTDAAAWPAALTYDVGAPLADLDGWLIDNRESHWLFLYFLLHLSNAAQSSVDSLVDVFDTLGWIGVTALGTLIAWYAGGADLSRRALRTGATALGVFAACGLLDMWRPTMETLALMAVAVAVSAALGVLLGLAAGLSDRCEKILRPVFDAMQVMPAFAYLLPFVLLFDIGVPSALAATVIYAAPPMARLTSLGLRSADPAAIEAATSLGAGRLQLLRTARLPLARKEMLLGLNQTIMMCLSMVVLASVVGAGGLGDEIYSALQQLFVGQAFAAGLAIVLLAVLLDRTTSAAGARLDESGQQDATGLFARLRGMPGRLALGAAAVALYVLGPRLGDTYWPAHWTVDVATPVDDFLGWFENNLGEGVPLLGGTLVWSQNFTEWILNPLRSGLQATPWWALLLLAAALGWAVGRLRAAVSATLALAAIGAMGLWTKSLDTLSQVLLALLVTLALGFVIGVLAARLDWLDRLLRPVLDTMQTMPQFVYLIPVIALFSAGRAAGIAAAVVFALPAVVRITAQGVRGVDPATLEAARSLGATGWQQLKDVQLPLARGALLVAVNQGVVLVLSIVVIAGMVGGGALGNDVVTGLSKADLALGLPAGAAIVCLGVLLDRLTQPAARRRTTH
ncbi:ABC transporter permease, partial [Streptomyces alkaliterrae]|uniref:ABC transporter permease n=1 Tax=Streptomyces alkaliterrae TaxID=2213162 RepID=UPI001E360D89